MFQEINQGKKYGNGRKSEIVDVFTDAKELLENDVIVVDIDTLNKDQIDQLLATFSIKTQYRLTDRGIHLYYHFNKKLPKESICGLGFNVEYKQKEVVVKRNGIERKAYNLGNIETLPDFLKPVFGKDLLGLVDGDGRYNKMFSHHIQLIKNAVDNRKEVMQFINNVILDEKLDDKKLDQAQSLTDSSIIEFLEKPHEKAKYIIDKYKPILYNDQIFIEINGFWKSHPGNIRAFLYQIFPKLSTTQIDEIYKQLEYRLGLTQKNDEYHVVKLKNGILKNGKFIKVNYKEFTPFYVDLSYNEKAECDEVDQIMNIITENNEEYIDYIYSVIAQSFNLNFKKRTKQPFFHILYGEGGNGKSIIMKMISEIFDENTASTVKPDQFTHNSNIYTLFGKLVNLGDDIKNEPLKTETLDIIKNVASCDKMAIREIYNSTQNMKRIHANLIYSSNHLLSSWEKGTSFTRRIKWLPFNVNVKKMVENGDIKDEVFDQIFSKKGVEYFFKKVVEAYFKVYSQGYEKVELIEDFNIHYHRTNDNASIFVNDLNFDEIKGNTPKNMFEEYEQWCEQNDYTPSSKKRFKEVLFKYFNITEVIKKVDGKAKRVYLKKFENKPERLIEEVKTDD